MKNFKVNKTATTLAFVLGFVVFIAVSLQSHLFAESILMTQVSGALLQAIIAALLTFLLLNGQTKQEALKERNMKVFEEKQKVYKSFLDELQVIIQDGKISTTEDNNELNALIFRLGELQMHTSKPTIDIVSASLIIIIQKMTDKEKDFYPSLTAELFKIVIALKKDLYSPIEDKDFFTPSFEKGTMDEFLRKCGLDVEEANELDDVGMHTYFWKTLCKQMANKGHNTKYADAIGNIALYVTHGTSGLRFNEGEAYDGFYISIPDLKNEIKITAAMYQSPLYDLEEMQNKDVDMALIKQCMKEVVGHSDSLYCSADISFYGAGNDLYKKLKKDATQRKQYVEKQAEKLDASIKAFVKVAKEKGL
jgi:hypothetical protein